MPNSRREALCKVLLFQIVWFSLLGGKNSLRLCLLIRSWVAIFLVYIAALAKEQLHSTINWYTVHFCTKWTLYLVLIMLWGAKMQNFRLPKVLALPYSREWWVGSKLRWLVENSSNTIGELFRSLEDQNNGSSLLCVLARVLGRRSRFDLVSAR